MGTAESPFLPLLLLRGCQRIGLSLAGSVLSMLVLGQSHLTGLVEGWTGPPTGLASQCGVQPALQPMLASVGTSQHCLQAVLARVRQCCLWGALQNEGIRLHGLWPALATRYLLLLKREERGMSAPHKGVVWWTLPFIQE